MLYNQKALTLHGFRWAMHSGELLERLGLRPGGHLPAAGLPERVIDGVRVYVLPANGPDPTSRRNKSSKHRVMAVCPFCDRHLSAGRLVSQHIRHCQKRIEHYDGESGIHLLTMPQECAEDCSTPGQPADESVAYWRDRVEWIADEATLRDSLRRYGAWDDLDTADPRTIKNRVLWCAACDWREEEYQRKKL